MTRNYSKVLVTGGAGFIGCHIVDKVLSAGFEVTGVDNLTTGQLENVVYHQGRKDFHFVKGDIRDFDLVKNIVKDIDVVFHEAALASVALSVSDPILTNDVNVTGTLNLLKACLDFGVKRFIYASSASVYGETKTLPLKEDMAPNPISPYAASKLAAENYATIFHEVYGLETVCLRYFNVYGPKQAYSPYSGVTTQFINRLLNNKSPIIYGDGQQSRDFVHVQDVVEANMLALGSKNAVGEVFNIASGRSTTVNHLAMMLAQIIGKNDLKPNYTDPRPGDVRYCYADISKARKLGFCPKISLEEGLVKLVEWYTELHKHNIYC